MAGYFFSDEPDPSRAQTPRRAQGALGSHPLARPEQVHGHGARHELGSHGSLAQIPLWKGAANYIGLDPYPCRPGEALQVFLDQPGDRGRQRGRALLLGRRAGLRRRDTGAGRPRPRRAACSPSGPSRSSAATWPSRGHGKATTSRAGQRLLRVLRLYNKGAAPNTAITAGPPASRQRRKATFRFVIVGPGLDVPVQARRAPLAQVRLSEALHGLSRASTSSVSARRCSDGSTRRRPGAAGRSGRPRRSGGQRR